MKTELTTLILLASAAILVLAVVAHELKKRLADGFRIELLGIAGPSAAALQMMLGALLLATFFGAVPLQWALLAGAAWAFVVALGQMVALVRQLGFQLLPHPLAMQCWRRRCACHCSCSDRT